MTKILGISGKKQSGKTTAGNFLFGSAMLSIGLVEYATIEESGELVVPYEGSEGIRPCIFPVNSVHPNVIEYMSENIWKEIKIYNFADDLKSICINILGLTERQCYGTEEEKSSLTNIEIPNTLAEKKSNRKMTARELMQYVGTDFFRAIYPNVWVDSTIRKIQREKPSLAVVVDCRFPNEVKGIQDAGGKVLRLTRNIFGDEDKHDSETALDEYDGFDAIIDNQNMSIGEQNEILFNHLVDWGFVNYTAVARTATKA